MAAPLPLSKSEIRLLGSLLKHKVRFMVVGLAAATQLGAPVVTQDVDLWFEKLGEDKISLALNQVGATYVSPSLHNPPCSRGQARNSLTLPSEWTDLEHSPRNLQRASKYPSAAIN